MPVQRTAARRLILDAGGLSAVCRISRSRIYKMTDDAELQERHANAQQVMESLLQCAEEHGVCGVDGALLEDDELDDEQSRPVGHKVTLGLYDEDESVHAIARG